MIIRSITIIHAALLIALASSNTLAQRNRNYTEDQLAILNDAATNQMRLIATAQGIEYDPTSPEVIAAHEAHDQLLEALLPIWEIMDEEAIRTAKRVAAEYASDPENLKTDEPREALISVNRVEGIILDGFWDWLHRDTDLRRVGSDDDNIDPDWIIRIQKAATPHYAETLDRILSRIDHDAILTALQSPAILPRIRPEELIDSVSDLQRSARNLYYLHPRRMEDALQARDAELLIELASTHFAINRAVAFSGSPIETSFAAFADARTLMFLAEATQAGIFNRAHAESISRLIETHSPPPTDFNPRLYREEAIAVARIAAATSPSIAADLIPGSGSIEDMMETMRLMGVSSIEIEPLDAQLQMIDRFFEPLYEIGSDDFSSRKAAEEQYRDLRNRLNSPIAEHRWFPIHRYVRSWFFDITRADAFTLRAGLPVLLAIHIYHDEYNAWPDSLQQLLDEGRITDLPKDPWSDTPLRYRRLAIPDAQGRHYLLYSVGPDTIDNNGADAIQFPFARQRGGFGNETDFDHVLNWRNPIASDEQPTADP